jgi:hypothetical protein
LPWETAPEGLVDFALLPSNVETAIAEARGRGLALDGPIPGGRLRPDGRRVAWQLALTYLFDLPFLCSDVTPRSLRVPEGPARQHANGAVGVSKLVVGVNNLAESTARYRALLGQEPQASRFVLGSATIELIAPARDDLGEGPCLLSLRTRDAHRAGDLNLSQTYHARIRLET